MRGSLVDMVGIWSIAKQNPFSFKRDVFVDRVLKAQSLIVNWSHWHSLWFPGDPRFPTMGARWLSAWLSSHTVTKASNAPRIEWIEGKENFGPPLTMTCTRSGPKYKFAGISDLQSGDPPPDTWDDSRNRRMTAAQLVTHLLDGLGSFIVHSLHCRMLRSTKMAAIERLTAIKWYVPCMTRKAVLFDGRPSLDGSHRVLHVTLQYKSCIIADPYSLPNAISLDHSKISWS